MIPIHLILEIVKFLDIKYIINFSLINEYTYTIYLNNKNYLGKLKLKECGMKGKGGDLYIYNKIISSKPYMPYNLIEKRRKIIYSYILIYSAENGYLSVVKYLVSMGIYDEDAFRSSVINSHLPVVKYLINIGEYNLDEIIITSSNLLVVKFLVDSGADIHYREDYILRNSARNGHLDIVKFLVSRGANVHANSHSALMWSAGEGHINIIKYLIELGVNIHTNEDYAFKTSVLNGNIESVKFLVEECGVDPSIHEDYAIKISARYGYLNIVKYLVSEGVDLYKILDDI